MSALEGSELSAVTPGKIFHFRLYTLLGVTAILIDYDPVSPFYQKFIMKTTEIFSSLPVLSTSRSEGPQRSLF
jgi:hypothetical protein